MCYHKSLNPILKKIVSGKKNCQVSHKDFDSSDGDMFSNAFEFIQY